MKYHATKELLSLVLIRTKHLRCWDLNPRSSDYESPPITTRPELPTNIALKLLKRQMTSKKRRTSESQFCRIVKRTSFVDVVSISLNLSQIEISFIVFVRGLTNIVQNKM